MDIELIERLREAPDKGLALDNVRFKEEVAA
jgi:hypothetical protein